MTKEQFVEKAKKVHGDKYDYSKVNFVDKNTEVCIICPKHGEFLQKPANHLKGYGCKKCGIEIVSKKLSLDTKKFIEKAVEIYGDKYDYSKTNYLNNHTHVTVTCKKHGEFTVTPCDFLDGHGCKKCANEERSKKTRGTKEQFIEKAKKVHGDKYDYSKVDYINTRTDVCIICPKHGEFFITPHEHLGKRGCKQCGIESRLKKRSLTLEQFIEKAKKAHGNKYDYSKVKTYINGKQKLPIVCRKHGLFHQRAEDHLNGHGCPKCMTSKMEDEIMVMLRLHGFDYIYREKSLPGISEIDIYIPKLKVGIECQGKQHFEPVDFNGEGIDAATENFTKQVERDRKKKNECEKQGIRLLYFSDLKRDFPYEVFTDKEKLLEEIKNGPENKEHI